MLDLAQSDLSLAIHVGAGEKRFVATFMICVFQTMTTMTDVPILHTAVDRTCGSA